MPNFVPTCAKTLSSPFGLAAHPEDATELAAEQVDTYLTWGEPPAAVKDKIEYLKARPLPKAVADMESVYM